MSRAAMILAAGFGTRMGALTADRPKPLIEVAGRPLIDHALAVARGAGAAPIAVNGHYRADQLGAHLSAHHPDVSFLAEAPDILDSAGAIKQALPVLGAAPIYTLNADALWDGPPPLSVLESAWQPERMDALMLLVPRDAAIGRQGGGDVQMAVDGRLAWDTSDTALVHTGAQIIDTRAIAVDPRTVFSLREIWDTMARNGRLFGCLYPGRWADIGHPAGIGLAERMLGHDAAL